MSQNSLTLPTTGTVSGLQMTQAVNNALDTLNTLASGASAPASAEAGQLWHDTANNILKIRSLDNTAWIALLNISESGYLALPAYIAQITGTANRIVNGGMAIDQVNEGASYTIPATNTFTYAVDQWEVICSSATASAITAQRVTDAPPGFINSLKVTIGSGASSVTGSDVLQISQPIEGANVNDLNYGTSLAVPGSLSFWIKASLTGTFTVLLSNAGGARTYVTTFTIGVSGTWQQIKIPNIPADQSGTWPTGNTQSLSISFIVAAGGSVQTSTLNAWQSGAFIAANTQTNNILTTPGASIQLSGVMFNAGAFCMPYEKRSIHQEIAACERYYFKTFAPGQAVGQGVGTSGALVTMQGFGSSVTSQGSSDIRFRTPMRVTPTVTTYNTADANAQFRNQTLGVDCSGIAANVQSPNNWSFTYTTAASSQVGHINEIHLSASARM